MLEKRLKKKQERRRDHQAAKGRARGGGGLLDDPIKAPNQDASHPNQGKSQHDGPPSLSFGKIDYGEDVAKKRKSDTLGLLKAVCPCLMLLLHVHSM